NYYLTPVFQTNDPEIVKFKDAMSTYFPDATGGGLALNGYAAGQLFLEGFAGITADGAMPTQQAYMDHLETWSTKTVGVVPSVTYTDQEHTGPDQSYII